MEAMIENGSSFQCQTFPAFENFNRLESAIRQFCPARVEQKQVEQQWEEDMLLDEETVMRTHLTRDEIPQLQPDEIEEIVDTFFNVECYEKDNADKSTEEYQFESYDHIQENGLQELAMIDGNYNGSNNLIMVEGDESESYSSRNDLCLTEPDDSSARDVITGVVDQGLHLVHLLLACAEAVGCQDTQLAESLLGQIWPCVSPWGNSLQRVSFCFATGLKSRLSLLHNVSPNSSFANRGSAVVSLITKEEKVEAFELLHHATPYIAFGFMAANEAICQASKGKEFLHIVDLGMEHTLQWPSLIRSLASNKESFPKNIRITGIIGDQEPLRYENSVRGLITEAKSLSISLTFHFLTEHVSPSSLAREKLDIRENESLLVNSVLHLHKHVKESRCSLKIILQSIKKLNPMLLTVIEQDANHNGPFFLGRFLESLHYYSAIFDSLEASLPRDSIKRIKIEKFHFAEEIKNVVACEGCDRIERHERADQWRRQLGRAGFHAVGLKCLDRVRSVLSDYGCDEYTVTGEKNCLQLGWKGRPIMLASAWQVNNGNGS